MKIGFIGLGIMGVRMASNLQDEGYHLVVHNRTKSKADPLVARGAQWADTPAELAGQVEILITMLADPEAVSHMAIGQQGFLGAMRPGSIWIDSSTVNPSFSRQMAGMAAERSVGFVDAPVAGTKGPAERGQLLYLVGGAPGEVEKCQPLFDIMGRKTIHIGQQGMGVSMKMTINLLLAQAMAGFSEAMALGLSLDIPQEQLFDVLLSAPATAPFISGKRSLIEGGEYEAAFPLKWMEKDLHLAAVTAYEGGVALPLGHLAKELYALARRHGLGEKDFSAIYQFLNQT
jgi:3-hydroxyisobutyrate dehydrogenase-like beta-hydroxyacid dehydrogenase